MFACAGLAAATAAFPAGPASATPISGQLQVRANVNFSSSGPTCSETGTEPNSTTPFTNNGASDAQTLDVTVTNTDAVTPDPADHTHVTGSITTATHVSQVSGSMTKYKLTASGGVSVVAAEGSASQCNVSAQMSSQSEFVFSEAKAGWLYLTRAQAKNMLSEVILISEHGTTPYADIFGGPKSTNSERVFLDPGLYEGLNAVAITGGPFVFLKAGTQSAALTGTFHAAGSALGGTQGTGAKFVRFPGSVSCSTHSAKLTWSSKAGQVASGSFTVNGAAKGSDRHPVAGHSVVLRHLSSTSDLKISAQLSLKGGGHASASRTFVACKG